MNQEHLAARPARRPAARTSVRAAGLGTPTRKLLDHLARRVSIVVGDNAESIARALGITPHEFRSAGDDLCARGLAFRETMPLGTSALRITDEGIASSAGQRLPPRRQPGRWWQKFW